MVVAMMPVMAAIAVMMLAMMMVSAMIMAAMVLTVMSAAAAVPAIGQCHSRQRSPRNNGRRDHQSS